MSICIDDKSCLKGNFTSLLPSVKAKFHYTVCLEKPCTKCQKMFVCYPPPTTHTEVWELCIGTKGGLKGPFVRFVRLKSPSHPNESNILKNSNPHPNESRILKKLKSPS